MTALTKEEARHWPHPCRIAGLTFTDLCNQRCQHCHNDSRIRVTKPQLTLKEWERVAADLRTIGVEFISFGGGESLTHPEFLDFARMLRGIGFRLGIITNGTADPERVPWELFETVSVSIEFSDASRQDQFRGYSGAQDAALHTLRYLRSVPVERELFTAVMRTNLDQLPALYELATREDVHYWKIIRFRIQGRGVHFRDRFALEPTDYRQVLRFMVATGRPLVISDPIFATLMEGGYYRQGCTCGTSSIRVEADGTITPCTFTADYHLGNVRKDSLREIWRTSPMLWPIRDRDSAQPLEECVGCEAWSHCRGGCYGSAFLATARIDRRDPQCWVGDNGVNPLPNDRAIRVGGGADMRSYVCSAYMAIAGSVSQYSLT